MKQLKTIKLEPYEAPAISEIAPVTYLRGDDDEKSTGANMGQDDYSDDFD